MVITAIDGYSAEDLERLRGEHDDDERSPFARDYDRLIYTEAFRRLQGKTQVATPGEADFFRSRLTHTIEVAQFARRLAEHLNRKADRARIAARRPLVDVDSSAAHSADQHKVDPDLCEAAAVLHDLGHSPFGHVGESVLAREVTRVGSLPVKQDGWGLEVHGSFNANAQSFRLATTCLVHAEPTPGLQLTRATLDAALKYPWVYGEQPEGKREAAFSVYPGEREDLAWVRRGLPQEMRYERSLEAQIMDWADDVAYAVHDVDDWHRAAYMPLARLAEDAYGARKEFKDWLLRKWLREGRIETSESSDVSTTFDELFGGREEAFQEFRNVIEAGGPIWDPATSAGLQAIRSMRSVLFDSFLTEVQIIDRPNATIALPPRYRFCLSVDPTVRRKNEILKELLWHFVVEDVRVATQQHGQAQSMAALFTIHERVARSTSPEFPIFPAQARGALAATSDRAERLRIVVDFLSGMTDGFALRRVQRLQAGGTRLHDFT